MKAHKPVDLDKPVYNQIYNRPGNQLWNRIDNQLNIHFWNQLHNQLNNQKDLSRQSV